MTPLRTEETNIILGAPEGWDESKHGQCHGLPAIFDSNGPYFYSYWQPSQAERDAIMAGKPIRLCVCASGHPPVHLAIDGVE